MSACKPCPHCGHSNLERALICFQCGHPVSVEQRDSGNESAIRRSQRILRTMWDPDSRVPEDVSLPLTGGTTFLAELHLEEPLACLACGTLNRPANATCVACRQALLAPETRSGLSIQVSARTDLGRVRANNEDSIGLWATNGMLLALVADGMGGAAAGEEASRLVVEAVQADFVGEAREARHLAGLGEELIFEKLTAALRAANQALIDRVAQDALLRGMGTTATLALVAMGRVFVAHVGDSRAYLVDGRQGWINQITSDHSFVEALVSAGHITEEQAAEHPMRNVLYRALGQTRETTVDVYDRYLKAGDAIVLCSDGLTRHVRSTEIAEAVLAEDQPEAAARRLVALANQRGGEDNISIVVIRLEGDANATIELPAMATMLFQRSDDSTAVLEDSEAAVPDEVDPAPVIPSEVHRKALRALGLSTDEIRALVGPDEGEVQSGSDGADKRSPADIDR